MSQILLLCRIDLSLFFLEQPGDPTWGLLRPRRLKHPPGHPAPPRSVSQRTYVESNRGWHLATCPGGAQRIYGFPRLALFLPRAGAFMWVYVAVSAGDFYVLLRGSPYRRKPSGWVSERCRGTEANGTTPQRLVSVGLSTPALTCMGTVAVLTYPC